MDESGTIFFGQPNFLMMCKSDIISTIVGNAASTTPVLDTTAVPLFVKIGNIVSISVYNSDFYLLDNSMLSIRWILPTIRSRESSALV